MHYYGLVFEIILSIFFFSFEHQGSNNKNWIHSPDTLLNGHVVYLVKVRNCFFLRYQARRLCGFYGSTSVFNKDGKVLKEHANFNGGLLTYLHIRHLHTVDNI